MSDVDEEPEGLADQVVEAFEALVIERDLDRLRDLFENHPGLANEIDSPRFNVGWPAIVLAANRGDREMVDLLLELGADIDARSEFWGRTIGVFDESPEALSGFLIERGALPEISDFVRAVTDVQVGEVRRLLAGSPALVERIDRPFFPFASPAIVAGRDHPRLVDLLLEFGADINARSNWRGGGFGVLDGASPEVAAHLIERGAEVDIHAAAGLGFLPRVKEQLRSDPSWVHARGGDGQTPLHVAATPEIIDYLLDHGGEIEICDEDHDSTPAQYQVDKPENCRRLIERGARIDLFMAAALGDLDLVKAELERSPRSIHARLHQEPYDQSRPRAPNIYNWKLGFRLSPHQVAHEKGHEEVYRALMERSPLNERFINACLCAEQDLVRSILAEHADIVQTLAARDRVRFADAAWRGDLAAARLMLEAGFDVDERDGEGTAISGALLFGNLEMVELLLSHGPDLTVRNAYGATPLGVCAWASVNFHDPEGDYPGCARRLLEAGSEVEDWMFKATPEVCDVLLADQAAVSPLSKPSRKTIP